MGTFYIPAPIRDFLLIHFMDGINWGEDLQRGLERALARPVLCSWFLLLARRSPGLPLAAERRLCKATRILVHKAVISFVGFPVESFPIRGCGHAWIELSIKNVFEETELYSFFVLCSSFYQQFYSKHIKRKKKCIHQNQ